LTVVRPVGLEFSVAVIPHTLSATTLGSLAVGDGVNIEYDVLARYARRD
jgi:riboflavin synthase